MHARMHVGVGVCCAVQIGMHKSPHTKWYKRQACTNASRSWCAKSNAQGGQEACMHGCPPEWMCNFSHTKKFKMQACANARRREWKCKSHAQGAWKGIPAQVHGGLDVQPYLTRRFETQVRMHAHRCGCAIYPAKLLGVYPGVCVPACMHACKRGNIRHDNGPELWECIQVCVCVPACTHACDGGRYA